MKLFSWNVNGIRAVLNKGAFEEFLSTYDPDIVCLQETKAQRDQFEIDFPQYEEHFFSAVKKGYSGTAIFSKAPAIQYIDGFPQDIIDEFKVEGDSYGNPNDEGRVIAAEFEKFWVVTVYTPNSKRDLSRLEIRHKHWDPAFLAYMKRLEETKPVLFCGDLNAAHTAIDLARPKDNEKSAGYTPEEREGMQHYIDAGFIDTFRDKHPDQVDAYSWWTAWGGARARNVGWRIDYWMASKSLMANIQKAEIHAEQMGSDHCPVSIDISL